MKISTKKGLVVLLMALMAGCSAQAPEISEEDAKSAAKQFVVEHVKFFSRNGSSTVDLPQYQFESVVINDEKAEFTITMRVIAVLDNDTKENDIALRVDKKSGKVVEFNGKRLPE